MPWQEMYHNVPPGVTTRWISPENPTGEKGKVKIYLDVDKDYASLVQTGIEDYIGSGDGQGFYSNRYAGSLISNKENDIYAFYRHHIEDYVYFNEDCKVTIQQMDSSGKPDLLKMAEQGGKVKPVWFLDRRESKTRQGRLLEEGNEALFDSPDFPTGPTNYYRSDDVCATAYFYLDKPESNLPELPNLELRMKDLDEKLYQVLDAK